MADRLVLWDFDGTLAWREGMWSGCALDVLDEHAPGHGVSIDRIRTALRGGFPWHAWEDPHPHLSQPGAWWEMVEKRLAQAFEQVYADADTARMASALRERYLDVAVAWQLFEDTEPALRTLSARGWHHAVLSNHVPELPALLDGLGLSARFDEVFTSAEIGYEKPHPQAFAIALAACGNPKEVWMVGDNPHADIGGAEAAGLRAILVRSSGAARYRTDGLQEAAELILGGGAAAANGAATP
jgi:putative hydrolase of the HAD superfamily